MKSILTLILCALLLFSALVGCTQEQSGIQSTTSTAPATETTIIQTEPTATELPIDEHYKYTTKSGYYLWPCLAENWVERKVLTTTTDDGTFFCMTTDKAQADEFVLSQRTLLRFLRKMGLETGALKYYATDYDDSFSLSSNGCAYIALSAMGKQRQVLVTLQSILGDYTDYGYVWAMSYAIAQEMGYETEPVPEIAKSSLDSFFAANPEAIHLLYPSFTSEFASPETVDNCKALAAYLFSDVNWQAVLTMPVEAQLDAWYELVASYAEAVAVPFARQTIGYAYYSQHVPLRIMTPYVEMMIADNYSDLLSTFFTPYFTDYESIYQTANTMNSEISAAVEFFGLENEAGLLTMNWVSYADDGVQKYLDGNSGVYYCTAETAYVATICSYLHEYYHHLRYIITGDYKSSWQSEAFSEIGEANSFWPKYRMDAIFGQETYADMFYAFTGHNYQGGRADYYETADILCYLNNTYQVYYHDGGPTISLTHYLIDLYGEQTACQLVCFPDTVEEVTGKNWEQLRSEWEQHIREKYAHVNASDWVS